MRKLYQNYFKVLLVAFLFVFFNLLFTPKAFACRSNDDCPGLYCVLSHMPVGSMYLDGECRSNTPDGSYCLPYTDPGSGVLVGGAPCEGTNVCDTTTGSCMSSAEAALTCRSNEDCSGGSICVIENLLAPEGECMSCTPDEHYICEETWMLGFGTRGGAACCGAPRSTCVKPSGVAYAFCRPGCGLLNEQCCDSGMPCASGLSCVGGTCSSTNCDEVGDYCCPNYVCDAPPGSPLIYCDGDTMTCALRNGQPCNPSLPNSGCSVGSSCVDGLCQPGRPPDGSPTDPTDPRTSRTDRPSHPVGHLTNRTLEEVLSYIYRSLLYVGLLIGLFLVTINGYKLMTSQGDPARVKDGKEGLTAAVLGLLFVLLAIVILRIILRTFLGGDVA